MKKNYNRLFLIAILFFVFYSPLKGQWVQCNGLYGGTINDLASSGNYIFAGSYGMWVSTNNGEDWFVKLPYDHIYSTYISGNKIFAGTEDALFLSVNNGQSWNQIGSFNNQDVRAIALYGNTIIAGMGYGGIYTSTNNGQSWTQNSNMIGVNSIKIKGNNIFATANGIYRSTNGGQNWVQIFYITNESFGSLAVTDSIIFTGSSIGLYLSTNDGQNWIQSGLNDKSIHSLDVSGNNVIAGTYLSGVWVSTNNGSNWSQTTLNDKSIEGITISGNNIFAGTYEDGLYVSSNNGQNWKQTGLNTQGIYSLSFSGNNIFAGTYNKGVYISTNNGLRWEQTTLLNMKVNCLNHSNNKVFAGTESGLFQSTNDGINWILNNPIYITSIVVNGNNIFGGKSMGVWRSTNNGDSWNFLNINQDIKSVAISENYIFAGADYYTYPQTGGVYRSTNNGQSWSLTGLNSRSVHSLATSGNKVFAGTDYGWGIFISTNYGSNWSQTSLSGAYYIYTIVLYGSNILAGTSEGVYLSTNDGATWHQKNEGFAGITGVPSLQIFNNYIYAGTYGYSVWRRPLSDFVGIQNVSSEIPTVYSLKQNYPNPFNPSTNIRYQIANTGYVSLKVFDILGKEISVLVNENQKPGTYEVTFDGSTYPSGIYFYRLEAGDFNETKKMILVK